MAYKLGRIRDLDRTAEIMPKHPFHDLCVGTGGLYAASGEQVQLFDLATGALKQSFAATAGPSPPAKEPKTETEAETTASADQPSRKKVKADKPPTEIRNHIHCLRPAKAQGVAASQHVVATGSEDKSLLVFDENLTLVAKHWFPKRPSSVDTFASDPSTVLVGDKFGDVYVQSANDTTAVLPDSREPILGHVSMLVDVVAAEVSDGRRFVITADRDEHIRVTQYPKSWIIERWLFGHTEFVSCLVQPPSAPQLLVSAGGDSFVCLWDWTQGELLAKVSLVDTADAEIAVKKMLAVPGTDLIALFAEGANEVIYLRVGDRTLELAGRVPTPAPVASIAASSDTLFVSYESETPDNLLLGAFSHTSHAPVLADVCASVSTAGSSDINLGNRVALDTVSQLRKRAQH